MCGDLTNHPFAIKCFERKVTTDWSIIIRYFLLYAYLHLFPDKVEEMAGIFQEQNEDDEEEEEEERETEETNWEWQEEDEWIFD